MGYMRRDLSRAVSSWSRSPGGCGFRGVFWVERIFFAFFFVFISSYSFERTRPAVSMRPPCWTYSHHCQIGDKNPSKRWNGEFRGFRICVGWISTTGFCVVGFMCPINFSRFSGYHAEGDHAPPLFRRLPRRGLPRPYR